MWRPDLITLHVASDFLIFAAYVVIPLLLWLLLLKGVSAPTHLVLWFIAFISLCGSTHLAEILTIWSPIYYVTGILKALTALVSVAASYRLFQFLRTLQGEIDRVIQERDYDKILEILKALQTRKKLPAKAS